MNKKQFIAVVEYFKEFSVFDDELERENDAQDPELLRKYLKGDKNVDNN